MSTPRLSYAESRREARLRAAAQLEDLIVVAKQVVLDLRGEPTREGQDDADLTAYGRVFWLRRQLGYVVGSLGVNAPATWVMNLAGKRYGTLLEKANAERKGDGL